MEAPERLAEDGTVRVRRRADRPRPPLQDPRPVTVTVTDVVSIYLFSLVLRTHNPCSFPHFSAAMWFDMGGIATCLPGSVKL